jgi:hypothetical protein
MINGHQRIQDPAENATQAARRAATPRLRYAAGIGSAAAAAVLVLSPPAAAAAMPPRPDNPSRTPVVVERVEVPVPIDDIATELVQMQLAAAAAAIVTAAMTKARLRRRDDRAVSAVIDITDPRILGRTSDDTAKTNNAVL